MKMEFSHSRITWRAFIDKFGSIGINKKKINSNQKGKLQKRGLAQPQVFFCFFFGCLCSLQQIDVHKNKFEEDLALFITKELVLLSFVEAPLVKGLVFKQNPQLIFPS
jgi:hypothetical protein